MEKWLIHSRRNLPCRRSLFHLFGVYIIPSVSAFYIRERELLNSYICIMYFNLRLPKMMIVALKILSIQYSLEKKYTALRNLICPFVFFTSNSLSGPCKRGNPYSEFTLGLWWGFVKLNLCKSIVTFVCYGCLYFVRFFFG